MNDATTPLYELKEALARFNAERGWGRFHTPQQLAMALSAEAGELLELFLWKREDEVPDRARLEEEMADVLICLSNLARRLDLDLMRAVELKIARNAEKYPVSKAFGRADKWDVLAAGPGGNGSEGSRSAGAGAGAGGAPEDALVALATAGAGPSDTGGNGSEGPCSAGAGAGGAPEDAPEATAEAGAGPSDTGGNGSEGPRSAGAGAGGAPEDAPEATAEAGAGPSDTANVPMGVSILNGGRPPMGTSVESVRAEMRPEPGTGSRVAPGGSEEDVRGHAEGGS